MVALSNVLHGAASMPISTKEFFRALSTTWTARSRGAIILNIGLAISGGVDSMALAALCSKLHKVDLSEFCTENEFRSRQRLHFRAFVVDHRAREGSAEEALRVSKNLKEMGLPAHVLELEWPHGRKPTDRSNFETLARSLRYQALGRACYSHQIEPLLTAHHEDDQVETVVMSLIRGSRGMDLHGMHTSANIPECFGIYGVDRSGGLPKPDERDGNTKRLLKRDGNSKSFLKRGGNSKSLLTEAGGVRLYRPLLNFSKSRLIATSVYLNAPWFEDKTNADPTLTRRNAIRHLYKTDMMPNALSKPAVLQLAHKMQTKLRTEEALTQTTFSCYQEFNRKAGTLRVRLPKITSSNLESERALEQRRAASFIRSLIYHITPKKDVDISTLGFACQAIFPQLFSKPPCGIGPKFAVAGVLFERLNVMLSHPTKSKRNRAREGKAELEQNYLWQLSRQPYTSPEWLDSSITFPPALSSENAVANPAYSFWSTWHLWDGRYWIRILNTFKTPITIRPLTKEDWAKFRSTLKVIRPLGNEKYEVPRAIPISDAEVKLLLKDDCPGDIRYTLPAIVITEEGTERIIALPTFGVVAVKGIEEKRLQWEIRYKCVSLEGDSGLQVAKAKSVSTKNPKELSGPARKRAKIYERQGLQRQLTRRRQASALGDFTSNQTSAWSPPIPNRDVRTEFSGAHSFRSQESHR